MKDQPQTWHYGLMAKYWAEFRVGGSEIAYYQQLIERYGQPALDVGCGTGRLLLPYLRAGLDVDGCDISTDMLALCEEKVRTEGFSPGLYSLAMHNLDIPRIYQTIYVCGSFGQGSTRQQDALALGCFYQHLAPGGALLLDYHMPYGGGVSWHWKYWLKENRRQLNSDEWSEPGERQRALDGSEYVMRYKLVDLDPFEQVITFQMRAELWKEEQILEQELRTLTINLYFKHELWMMLEQAGFEVITIQGDYTVAQATADHEVLVFIARK